MQQNKPKSSAPVQPHHRVRTFFASLCGIIAISLVLSSLVIVWLNRTLTDTGTFVKTVAPLATKPEVQTFVAQKASEQIVKNAPTTDLAAALLPAGQANDKTTDQLNALLQPIVYNNVIKVVQSPTFAQTWQNTIQTAHASLVNQLDNGSSTIDLDLNPTVTAVITQLKTTDLSVLGDQLDVKPDSAKIDLTGSGIAKAHTYYQDFKKATWFLVGMTVVFAVLAVVISVNHLKTLRRMLFGTGALTLLFAFSVWAASQIRVNSGDDITTRNAVITIAQTLLHNLQIASLIIGVVCILSAVGLKLYSNSQKPATVRLKN